MVGRYTIPEDSCSLHVQERVFHKLQAFHGQLDLLKEHSGHVVVGSREALQITAGERIIVGGEYHDWQRGCDAERRLQRKLRSTGEKNVNLAGNKLPEARLVSVGVWDLYELESKILALLVAKLG